MLSAPQGTPAEAPPSRPKASSRLRRAWQPALEIAAILAWSLWVGRGFLDFDPALWPHGGDYGLSVEPLYQWDLARQCGACVLWNGFFNGGAPAFLETHAPFQHPLIILLTLLSDPIAASKITLVLSLALAGLGQWWLGHSLRVGWLPRLWSALLAVAGGHLAGRMELGLVWMVFSNATASLVLAPLLRLGQDGRRRDGVAAALLLASAFLSGQGYAQAGLVVVCLIAGAVFFLDLRSGLRPVWREFARTAALALLLTGILWVPLANNLPLLTKDTEPEMLGAQPLGHIHRDFLISDVEYFIQPGPGRQAFPAMYAHYIGWFPVALFGLAALRLPRARSKRSLLFLILPVIAIVLLSSTLVPDLVGRPVPFPLSALRYPTLMLGVAVPLILGAAATQLDELLGWMGRLGSGLVTRASDRSFLAAVTAVVVLWFSLPVPYRFTQHWMRVFEVPTGAAEVADRLVAEETAWVQPAAESYWGLLLVSRGQKLTGVYRPWWLDGVPIPLPSVQADRASENPSMAFDLVVNDIGIAAHPGVNYAAIEGDGGTVACAADARGGRIRIDCPESAPGELTVMEHNASGWQVACNGEPVPLADGPWLAISGVSGPVACEFTYFNWDVPLGLAFVVLGVWAAGTEWLIAGASSAGSGPAS